MKNFLFYIPIFLTTQVVAQDLKISSGTSTITFVTPDTVWMAADSKKSLGSPTNMKENGFKNKILQKDSVFYMIAGYPNITDTLQQTVFDFEEIMNESISKSSNIDSIVDYFINESFRQLSFLLKINYRFFFDIKNNQNHPIFISVSITTCSNNTLKVRNFNIEFIGSGSQIGFDVKDNKYKATTYLHPMGMYDEIYKIIMMPGFSFAQSQIKEALIYMINLESKSYPRFVGGTVDVIKIYKGGFEWLTNNRY